MTARRLLARVTLLVALPLISVGCGGGSDADAGGLTPFNIVPTTLTLTATGCPAGYVGRVYVYGGAGPYRVSNTGDATNPSQAVISVSKTTVDRPGDYFEVSTLLDGTCLSNVAVVVVDQLGRQATLSVNSVAGP